MYLCCLAEQITGVYSQEQPGGMAKKQQPPGGLSSYSGDVKLETRFEKRTAVQASVLLKSAEEARGRSMS